MTDLSNNRAERRRNSDRFFELSNELFCILDQDTQIVQANPAFLTHLGLRPETGHPLTFTDIIAPEDITLARDLLQRVATTPEVCHQTMRCQTTEQKRLYIEWSLQLADDGLIYAAGHDVTVARDAQRRSDELSQALEVSNRELQEFVFVSSHDLQEPLRKVRAFGDRLLHHCQDQLDDRGQDYLSRMDAAAARMQMLIDDLLAYSRVTTQSSPVNVVDLNDLMAQVCSNLELTIQEQNAQITIEQLPPVRGDASQLGQVFQNLVSNALKFVDSDTAPVIIVRSEPSASPDMICIVVADQGIGIEPQYTERIFAPFQRLHGRQAYAGSGIGLAIVRKIVQRHGGSVEAEANPGGGTRMVVLLPAAEG